MRLVACIGELLRRSNESRALERSERGSRSAYP